MPERKLKLVVGIDDGAVNGIVDLEREILARNICGQAARKYLDSLQDDMAQQVETTTMGAGQTIERELLTFQQVIFLESHKSTVWCGADFRVP